MKKREDREVDRLLETISSDLANIQNNHINDFLPDDFEEKLKKYEMQYTHKGRKKKLIWKYAFIFIAIATIVSVPVYKAEAWNIWPLQVIADWYNTHVRVETPSEDYMAFYVDDAPQGYEVTLEMIDEIQAYVLYENNEGKYIEFLQAPLETISIDIDKEHSVVRTEYIGDNEVMIKENDENIVLFFNVAETGVCITTDANYNVGKNFIENLKKY